MRRLKYLEQAQWWPRERLHAERDHTLATLVRIAYDEVPYYRSLMDQAGVKPADIRCKADLARIPISTKDTIRPAYPHDITRDTGQRTYDSPTSGSTGKNFCVKEDPETSGIYRACFFLALEWAGWHLGERHLQTGMTLERNLPRKLKDALLRCHYVSAYDLSDEHLDQALDLLDRRAIRHLWGYPGSLYYIARRALVKGWNHPLRSIVTWGDNLYPHYRTTIEQAFATSVTDTYGCAEGIQISAQCGHSTTYHVHTLDTVVEYLDNDGAPVSPGQPGNLILTRLHPGPMPLIRYSVGDMGVSAGDRECPCGRGFDVMESVNGRSTDVIVTPNGNRLIVHFFTGLIEHFPEIDCFQVVQEDPASIVLRLQPVTDISPDVQQRLVALLKEKGAGDLRIDVQIVPEIPLPSTGKRRFVISNQALV